MVISGWRDTSTIFGERMHMEQSLVGKVLSSMAMWPPMSRLTLDEVDMDAVRRDIEGGLDTGNARPDHDNAPMAVPSSASSIYDAALFRICCLLRFVSLLHHLPRDTDDNGVLRYLAPSRTRAPAPITDPLPIRPR